MPSDAILPEVEAGAGDSLLARLRRAQARVREARRQLFRLRDWLAPPGGVLAGRVLEYEFQFPLVVERLEGARDVRAAFQYTRDGWIIDVPARTTLGVARIVLAGRTFWSPVRVNGVEVDGDSALKTFQELVERYVQPDIGTAAEWELWWTNLLAPVSAEDPFGEQEWRVFPLGRGVRVLQQAQRPFQRFFQLEFLGLASNRDVARQRAEDGFLAGLFSRGVLGRLFGSHEWLATFREHLEAVFGVVREVADFFRDAAAVVTAVNDYVRGVTQYIRASFAQVRDLLTAVYGFVGRIEEGLNLVRSIPDEFAEQWRLLRRTMPGLVGVRGRVRGVRALAACYEFRDALLAARAMAHAFDPGLAGYRAVRVGAIAPGATLERIAGGAGVSAQAVIDANRLRYPFVVGHERPERRRALAEAEIEAGRQRVSVLASELADAQARGASREEIASLMREQEEADRRIRLAMRVRDEAAREGAAAPGVLYVGDRVHVPARAEPHMSVRTLDPETERMAEVLTGRAIDDDDRLFGLDLALSDEGDLVWRADGQDLELERGVDHVARVQARYVRLPLNALRFAPGIGNFAWDDLARWQTPVTARLLAAAMYRTLRQDPRVREIRDVRASTERGEAVLRYVAVLVNDRVLPDVVVQMGRRSDAA